MKKLNNDPKQRNSQNITTLDQIIHQLLLNRKSQREAIKVLKNRKATGLNDICVDQIKEFSPKTKQ